MAASKDLLGLLVLVLSVLSGACSSRLTREDASTLIARHEWSKRALSFVVPVGTFCDATETPDPDQAREAIRLSNYPNLAEHFIELSWLYGARPDVKAIYNTFPNVYIKTEHRDVTESVMMGPIPPECVASLKKEQSKFGGPIGFLVAASHYHFVLWTLSITPSGLEAGLPKNGGAILLANKIIGKTTGLAVNADGTTTAEFTWRWAPTELAKRLKMNEGLGGELQGKATFKLYDDGWRIVNVEGDDRSPY